MGWGELPTPGAVVDSRNHIGQVRGTLTPTARPSEVTDAVVCAVARKLHGHFTHEQKAQVAAVLAAGMACGFAFTWTDVDYQEVAS